MTEMTPAVSVVMPARNAADTIVKAVASVLDQRYSGDIELVVAAAGSNDATEATLAVLAADDPTLRIVANPTGSTPAGLNAAIDAAAGEVIARCDAHCVLPPGYIAAAVADLAATGADVVGGIQDPRGTTLVERAVAAAMRSWLGSGGAAYRTGRHAGPTDTVYLGVFRRSALERVGGFNDLLLRNQDYELNYRIRSTGGVVWLDPALRVAYLPRRNFRALWKQYFDFGMWKRKVLRLHPGSMRLRQLGPPAFVVALGGSAMLAAAGNLAAALIVPVVYVTAVAITALAALVRERDHAVLLSPVALVTMHVAWGVGFLLGSPTERVQGASLA